ncbi:LutB/LldF family L-lactate oxidation iron-sulfur protein [Peptococcus simiae]|uniref:LutB/LldF family L-lactate oxidation iron-sulfur protein n=1 Tax=Peptococcus simiae TaxID=1643805 RepID=UPI0039803D30
MAILVNPEQPLRERLDETMNNAFTREATALAQDNFNAGREAYTSKKKDWQAIKDYAAAIRAHTLDHLDDYLATFIDHATANGSQVHLAKTDKEARDIVLGIIEAVGGKSVVKSKSMMSEEVGINPALQAAGIEVTETDLGEWILELDDWDTPSHILAPAMHKDRYRIHELFTEYGYTGTTDIPEMTRFARESLRKKFLAADVGMTGCNFAIASTGSTCIMTNEGNGRMVTSLPSTQIVLMGMERIVPDMSDLDAMMQVLPQSVLGLTTSSYLSFTHGPRRADEIDGPDQVHIIIIDNGRSHILGSPFHDMLRCIRCGTCQNVCPVYRHITGHGYGSIYEGPMGIVLTPLLAGKDQTGHLPYLSTLCGECTANCPVEIPLHELILKHRESLHDRAQLTPEAAIFKGAGLALGSSLTYKAMLAFGRPLMRGLALVQGSGDHLDGRNVLPVLSNWTKGRNLPLLAKPFHQVTARQLKGDGSRD